MQKWQYPRYSFWAATIATVFYFIAVYANASWLIPKFYKKGKRTIYIILSVLIIAALLLARMEVEYVILWPLHLNFYSWSLSHFSFVFITNFLAFSFGALLRVSIDYLSLLRQQEEMKTRQMATELNLLKSQVQPHFLFNTLNNIYYLAYTKNERTPEVISKLSDIMRYFVDEAPKERVPLSTEIQFLRNYIELEQIRMLHPVQPSFTIKADKSLLIPPMLLVPLVENIFKHGIDKTIAENEVCIELRLTNGHLQFTTRNTINRNEPKQQSGVGLANLAKRLDILYGDQYELKTQTENDIFTVTLKFPYEDAMPDRG
jgi:LytS/YehU family sensor histidine kinase